MYRKFLTLVLIAGSLGLVLFVKSFLFEQPKTPSLLDRLPSADFLAKANILELAKETNSMLQYNKLSMRDFTTYEFLLGQGKQYGIDLESNLYLFANVFIGGGVIICFRPAFLSACDMAALITKLGSFINDSNKHWKSKSEYISILVLKDNNKVRIFLTDQELENIDVRVKRNSKT
jgi:hypothetical protein